MNETAFPINPTIADYKTAIAECFSEIKRLNRQMEEDGTEIERLKASTQDAAAQTRAMLEQLKVEFSSSL